MLERLKNNAQNYFSNGPKAVFVVVLLFMCVSISMIQNKKTVAVLIDGQKVQVTTFKSNLHNILKEHNIAVGPKDKIMPGLDSRVKNGDTIQIKRAVDVAIEVDGKELKVKSAEEDIKGMLLDKDVQHLLAAKNIKLDEDDKISPSVNEQLRKGMKVSITIVQSEVVTEVKPIEFSTVMKKDDDMEKGVNKTLQEGQPGSKELSFKVIYENGKEVSRKLLSEIITKNPVDKIVAMGTLGVLNPSRGGKVYYTSTMAVKSTAYSADFASTGKRPGDYGFGMTATGTRAKRTVDGYSSVAVDPRVIPLGTRLYIPGYGLAIAEDTGVRGNTIDLYFDSHEEATNWGVRWLTVYILK